MENAAKIQQEPESSTERVRPSYIHSGRWVLAGTIISRPLQLATNVLLARLLQPAAFGVLGLVNSAAVSLAGIGTFGLDGAINKFVAEFYRRHHERGVYLGSLILWGSLLSTTAFFGLLWFLHPYWAHRLFPVSITLRTIELCLTLGWLNVLFTLWVNLFTGLQMFRQITLLNLGQAVFIAISVSALGWIFGVNGAILGYVVAAFLCSLWALREVWRIDSGLLRWPRVWRRTDVTTILHFSIPAWLGYFTIGPVTTLAYGILARQPNGPYELGVFNTANALKMILGVLPGIVSAVIAPALLEEGGALGNPRAYADLLRKSMVAFRFLTVPMLIVLLFLREILFKIYGASYAAAPAAFLPITVSMALGIVISPAQFALLAKNRIWGLQVLAVFEAWLIYALASWLVPRYLGLGLAWSLLFAQLLLVFVIQEYGVHLRAMPAETRRLTYGFVLETCCVLAFAILLPPVIRWILAVPLSALSAVFILRQNPSVADWIVATAPTRVKAVLRQMFARMTIGVRT